MVYHKLKACLKEWAYSRHSFAIGIITLALLLNLTGSQSSFGVDIGVYTFFSGEGLVEEDYFDGQCSLIEAIKAANTNTSVDVCPAGSSTETDTIVLWNNSLFELDAVNNTHASIGPNGLPIIIDDLIIQGNGSTIFRECRSYPCVLNPSIPKFRLLHLGAGADLELQNLTLSGGKLSNNSGGGIYTEGGGSFLKLDQCTVSYNVADIGGGVFLGQGETEMSFTTANIEDSIITSNSATSSSGSLHQGGGIFAYGAIVTISDSTITSNHADSYGGGFNYMKHDSSLGNVVNIYRSTFTGNSTSADGGAISCEGIIKDSVTQPFLNIFDSVIDSNTADADGAGVNFDHCNLTVERSSISENVSGTASGLTGTSGSGAAICSATINSLILENVTISGNTSKVIDNIPISNGGALFLIGGDRLIEITNSTITQNKSLPESISNRTAVLLPTAGARIKNSVIADNFANSCSYSGSSGGTLTENVNNFFGDTTCDGSADGDPKLGPLQDNGGRSRTHMPLSGSPLIGGGDNLTCLTDDQRKEERPQGSVCDIGSVEKATVSWFTIPLQGNKAVIFCL